jgi:antitoxin component YwqK of YwqJK toxin-antitoxin module
MKTGLHTDIANLKPQVMRNILLLSIAFIFFGCDNYPKGDGQGQIYYENGELKSELFVTDGIVSTNIFDDPISGDCVKKHYFDSGEIFLKDTYKDGKKVESIYYLELNGNEAVHKKYHTNGTIKEEQTMGNDSNIGLRREYNENGTLIQEWVNKYGESDIVKSYDENGQNVLESYHYNPQKNKYTAEFLKDYTYYENFNLKSKTIYETHFEKEGSKWTITKFCYDESGIEIPCP